MPFPDALRIALFTYATQPRGGVLHALALGEALHDLGHAVVLYALDDSGRGFIREPRCSYVLIPVEPTRGDIVTFVERRIELYVRAWDNTAPAFDIYHAHDGISGNALATLVDDGAIPHYLRTVHHLDDFGSGELARLQDRSILRAAECLVVSRVWGERVASAYGRSATVVPNGVDGVRFSPVAPAERARLRAAAGFGAAPLFVTIGGIEPRKNSLALLDAFAEVRRLQPSARLAIAGGTSIFEHSAYRAAFDARAAQLGISADSLTITGKLGDAQIVELLRAAHAFVFPSLVEGFGLVVLEALACATPVITSAIAPFTEYLPADAALLVNPRDPSAIAAAMLRALDPAVAATVALNGRAIARRFSWKAAARAHALAYATFHARTGRGVTVHA